MPATRKQVPLFLGLVALGLLVCAVWHRLFHQDVSASTGAREGTPPIGEMLEEANVDYLELNGDRLPLLFESGASLPPELRAYILADFRVTLGRALGTRLEAVPAREKKVGQRSVTVDGRLRFITEKGDVHADALGDRIRDVVDREGRREVVISDELIEQYREAMAFWSERPGQFEALSAFLEQLERFGKRKRIPQRELSKVFASRVPVKNSDVLIDNPLFGDRFASPSPLAYGVEELASSEEPLVLVTVLRRDEARWTSYLLELEASGWRVTLLQYIR